MANVIESILVHVDGTEASMTACQYAVLLAKGTGARLVAMYVINALAGVSKAMEPLRPLSIFKHYGSAIENGIAWPSFVVITLIGAAFAGLAAAAFAKRDIYT